MPENPEDLVVKRNRIAKQLEGSKFKAKSSNDLGLNAKTKELPTTVINRDIILQDLLKLVSVCEMDECFKEILRIRLTYPDNAVQLYMALGARHGIQLHTIFKMEEYAKEKVVEYLKKHTLQDAINEFNASNQKDAIAIKNKMASEKKIVDQNGNSLTA